VPPAPHPLLKSLAWLFAAATLLYAGVWLYTVRLQPQARLGIESRYLPDTRSIQVQHIDDGSPAAVAGLQAEDVIVSVDGTRPRGPNPVLDLVLSREPGETVRLAVERPGNPPAHLDLVLVLGEAGPQPFGRSIAIQLVSLYPLPFVVVGLAVLLLRPDDRNVWLLALVFAGFVAGAPVAALAHVPPGCAGSASPTRSSSPGCPLPSCSSSSPYFPGARPWTCGSPG